MLFGLKFCCYSAHETFKALPIGGFILIAFLEVRDGSTGSGFLLFALQLERVAVDIKHLAYACFAFSVVKL